MSARAVFDLDSYQHSPPASSLFEPLKPRCFLLRWIDQVNCFLPCCCCCSFHVQVPASIKTDKVHAVAKPILKNGSLDDDADDEHSSGEDLTDPVQDVGQALDVEKSSHEDSPQPKFPQSLPSSRDLTRYEEEAAVVSSHKGGSPPNMDDLLLDGDDWDDRRSDEVYGDDSFPKGGEWPSSSSDELEMPPEPETPPTQVEEEDDMSKELRDLFARMETYDHPDSASAPPKKPEPKKKTIRTGVIATRYNVEKKKVPLTRLSESPLSQ